MWLVFCAAVLFTTAAVAIAWGSERDRDSVRVLSADVVAARHTWVRIEVTPTGGSTVTFSVFPTDREDPQPLYELTTSVFGTRVFEWRGQLETGQPVPDGTYLVEIAYGQTRYSVPVRVLNAPGSTSKMPPAPTGLVVVASQENTLTWNKSPSAAVIGYKVYRAAFQFGTYEVVGTTAVGLETFTDLPPQLGIYWYEVSAVSASKGVKKREGAPSTPVSSDNVHMSQAVGLDGGTLVPTTGTVSLEIPAGALATATAITIDQVANPPAAGTNRVLVSRVFDLGPSGTSFVTPATLTLRYDIPREFPLPHNYPLDTTWAQYWDRSSGEWTRLKDAKVDESTTSVRVRLPNLSILAGASVTVPHGGYSSSTTLCGYCHQSHAAPGPNLHPYPTEKETCYQCHNGVGANSDVQAEFGETTIGSSTKTSYHPVPAPKDGITITCSDCHTPHRLRTEDTWLLRVSDGAGGYLYSTAASPIGNQFCYACHGSTSTYPAPYADHSAFDTSIHNTSAQVPNPSPAPAAPDGTGTSSNIKCLDCHEQHSSDQTHLTLNGLSQEALCYSCHTQGTPNTSGGQSPPWTGGPFVGSNVYNDFNGTPNDYSTTDGNGIRIYHHPIATAEQAGGTRQVECVSCHNSHIADQNDGATTSKAADPTQVTLMSSKWLFGWDFTSGYLNRGSNVTQYCTTCHVSPTTTAPINAGANVPYDVRMVNDTSTDADTNVHDKFAASEWSTSRHGDPSALPNSYPGCANRGLTASQCVVTCTSCHDFHGSSNAYMLRQNVVAPDAVTFTVTDATWTSGKVTLTITPTKSIADGISIVVSGIVPSGYSGTFVTTNTNTGNTITYDLASDPGTYTSGGTVTARSTYTLTGFTALDTASDRLKLQTFCLTCHIEQGASHNATKLCTECHFHGSNKL